MSEHPWIVGKSGDEVRREYFPPAETSAPGECRHDRALDLSCGQRECPDCGTSLEVGCEQCAPLRDQLAKHNAALAELRQQLAQAMELLREIRDGEVNEQDEADKFLRDHIPSELSRTRSELAAAQAGMSASQELEQRTSDRISQKDPAP